MRSLFLIGRSIREDTWLSKRQKKRSTPKQNILSNALPSGEICFSKFEITVFSDCPSLITASMALADLARINAPSLTEDMRESIEIVHR